MNFTDINFNFGILQWVVTAAIAIYSWLINRQAASAKELSELKTRIVQFESELKYVPSHQQVTELIGKLSGNRSKLDSMSERIAGLSRQLDNINQFLLKSK